MWDFFTATCEETQRRRGNSLHAEPGNLNDVKKAIGRATAVHSIAHAPTSGVKMSRLHWEGGSAHVGAMLHTVRLGVPLSTPPRSRSWVWEAAAAKRNDHLVVSVQPRSAEHAKPNPSSSRPLGYRGGEGGGEQDGGSGGAGLNAGVWTSARIVHILVPGSWLVLSTLGPQADHLHRKERVREIRSDSMSRASLGAYGERRSRSLRHRGRLHTWGACTCSEILFLHCRQPSARNDCTPEHCTGQDL